MAIPSNLRPDNPDAPAARLDLERFLPYRLNHLADRISDELARFYAADYGLTVAQWRVLAWLNQSGVLSATRIGQLTRMDKARVSRAVRALLERGLINRTPARHDQRHQDLSLSAAGRDLLERLIPRALAWESDLLGVLSGGEYRDLMRCLDKLERRLAESPPK